MEGERANETSGLRDGRKRGPFFTAQKCVCCRRQEEKLLAVYSGLNWATKRNDIARNKVRPEREEEEVCGRGMKDRV